MFWNLEVLYQDGQFLGFGEGPLPGQVDGHLPDTSSHGLSWVVHEEGETEREREEEG